MLYLDFLVAKWNADYNFRLNMVCVVCILIGFTVGWMSGFGMGVGSAFEKEKINLLEKMPLVCRDYYCNAGATPIDLNRVSLDMNFGDFNQLVWDANDAHKKK